MNDKKGKLIVIEAPDGSGKATQTKKLYNKLVEDKYDVLKVEYPDYNSNSSALIKMYLSGEFGDKPNDVNAYAASTFFAVDRFASFKKKWGAFYENGGIILADRYTTSNMVHQASKIKNVEEKKKFLDWLWDLEFNLMGLPIPDATIFLDLPPEYSKSLIKNRKNKFTGEEEKDIHERDEDYLNISYKNAVDIAEKYGWIKINCIKGDKIKNINEIHEEIYKVLKEKTL
ncbi:thymidylate kinase [Clostridium tetani]|nr:thymidylate kinase [Clostridium tetani]QBD86314.1 thymidylate kinase [Clostridium tetani]